MAISNFNLPTGLTVSGSSSLTGSLYVSKNVVAESFTGSFSGSEANIANITSEVVDTGQLILPEESVLTIAAVQTDQLQVLEYANISGTLDVDGNINTANLNVENSISASVLSASNLYLLNDFTYIANTIQTDALEVISVAHITGVLAVDGITYIKPTGSLNITSPATASTGFLDVAHAINLLDNNIQTGLAVQQSYDGLRIKITGSVGVSNSVFINLTNINANFGTSSLDYITLNYSFKEDGRWKYQLTSAELFNSSSNLWVELTAPSGSIYKLIAVNERDGLFIV